MKHSPASSITPFQPTDKQQAEITAWFQRYDALTQKGDLEGMASEASFPLTVISDDSQGNGVSQTWTRADFIRVMNDVTAHTPKDLKFDTTRTALMLNENLAVVMTEWRMDDESTPMTTKYADVLVKENGAWKFKTMVQGGWGDALKPAAAHET